MSEIINYMTEDDASLLSTSNQNRYEIQDDKEWHARYRNMKEQMEYTNADIANITGNTADSVKSTTQPNKSLPRWAKLAIVIHEELTRQL